MMNFMGLFYFIIFILFNILKNKFDDFLWKKIYLSYILQVLIIVIQKYIISKRNNTIYVKSLKTV